MEFEQRLHIGLGSCSQSELSNMEFLSYPIIELVSFTSSIPCTRALSIPKAPTRNSTLSWTLPACSISLSLSLSCWSVYFTLGIQNLNALDQQQRENRNGFLRMLERDLPGHFYAINVINSIHSSILSNTQSLKTVSMAECTEMDIGISSWPGLASFPELWAPRHNHRGRIEVSSHQWLCKWSNIFSLSNINKPTILKGQL